MMTTTSSPTTTAVDTTWRWPIPGTTAAVIGGPLLLAATNAMVNFNADYMAAQSTTDYIRFAAEHPLYQQIVIVLGLAAVALLVPAAWAITALLRERTPVLAAIGGWLTATGYLFALILSTDSNTMLAVARAGGDPSVYVDAVDNHLPVTGVLVVAVFGIGALLGCVILGIAMLRQRSAVPMWCGWALILAEPVRVAGLMTGLPIGPPLASLLILAAFTGTLLAFRRRSAVRPGTAVTPAA